MLEQSGNQINPRNLFLKKKKKKHKRVGGAAAALLFEGVDPGFLGFIWKESCQFYHLLSCVGIRIMEALQPFRI